LLAIFSCGLLPIPEDTAHLAAHLKAMRGRKQLSSGEYKAIQAEYLAWIDVRVKAGSNPDSMNAELKAAGLFPRWGNFVEENFKSHAGYLEPLSMKPVRGTGDILVIEASIYQGIGSRDVTAVLYQRSRLTRLTNINASPDDRWPYYLSGLDIAENPPTGEILVASGWVVSNCTSTWNGKRIRIDRLNGLSLKNVLSRDLGAQDREPQENVAAWVQGDAATFLYNGTIRDSEMLSTSSIARYRVAGDQAVRETPSL